jgi:putative hydroxymethylpyrimidine transport system substrate-binding protein
VNSRYPVAGLSSAKLAAGAMLVAALIAMLLGGCGGGNDAADTVRAKPLETVRVTLDGNISAANIGFRIAEKRGYFEDEGFEVVSSDPGQPGQAVPLVAGVDDEFGIVQEPQVVMAGAKDAPVVAVGSVIAHPMNSLIWLKRSKIRSVADLKGKSIALPGIPYQKQFLKVILAQAGLTLKDVKLESLQYHLLPALLTGRVAAIFGASWSVEGKALQAQGEEPVIRRVQDFGIPTYEELVVIASSGQVREEPETVRGFMSALSRGIAVVEQNPKATAKLIFEDPEHNPLIRPQAIGASVEATLPLLSRDRAIDFGKAKRLIAWMHEKGMIENEPSVAGLFTNEFLSHP